MAQLHRLSALDALFIGIETSELHMHVGGLLIFDSGPLSRLDGGIDYSSICKYVGQALARIPSYRRRLRPTPWLRHPVWVDDEHFDLHYHVRHTALPRPGDERQLKRLTGRIFSQGLDKSRPLWEIWVVEGLAGDRFALICKVHHAMADGVGGIEMLAALLRATPDSHFESDGEWAAQAPPRGLELLSAELRHRSAGLRLLLGRARETWHELQEGQGEGAQDLARGILRVLRSGLSRAPATSLNPDRVGPHRRFDLCRFPLEEVKAIKRALGGKVNDAVLAISAGALRRHLERRGDEVSQLQRFRVMMPVSLHPAGKGRGEGTNKLAVTFLELPLHMAHVKERYLEILRRTSEVKEQSHQVEGVAFLEELGDISSDLLVREGVQLAGLLRPYNVVITNVPGPPFPLYLLGARLESMFPLVPLFHHQGLGIAVCSYAGSLCVGLGADRDAVPQLHELVTDFEASFDELSRLAGSEASRVPR